MFYFVSNIVSTRIKRMEALKVDCQDSCCALQGVLDLGGLLDNSAPSDLTKNISLSDSRMLSGSMSNDNSWKWGLFDDGNIGGTGENGVVSSINEVVKFNKQDHQKQRKHANRAEKRQREKLEKDATGSGEKSDVLESSFSITGECFNLEDDFDIVDLDNMIDYDLNEFIVNEYICEEVDLESDSARTVQPKYTRHHLRQHVQE